LKTINDLFTVDVLYCLSDGLRMAISEDHEAVETFFDWLARACLRRMEREYSRETKTRSMLVPIGMVPLDASHVARMFQVMASRSSKDRSEKPTQEKLDELLASLTREDGRREKPAPPRTAKTKLKN
jgi:hypothetical protein